MKLLEFPHSHYCEKARWALDSKGLKFQAIALMPGYHIFTVRKYAQDTSVPVLLDAHHAVQGSSAIIDYLDNKYPSYLLSPKDPQQLAYCLQLEEQMDKIMGENIRTILYYSLLAYPKFIRHCFTHSMPRVKQGIFQIFYPILRKKIYKSYVISEEKYNEARYNFEQAMEEIAQIIAQQPYLLGDQFSRADVSIASMLSLLVMPEQHPFPWQDVPDKQAREFLNSYKGHPVFKWTENIYQKHRIRS